MAFKMFKLHTIETHLFTGMWLNNVKNFKWEIKNNFNLILGQNGCGKSRLLRIATPLCPNTIDFPEGGWERVVFEHDNVMWESKCVRTKSGYKCSLFNITDNVEFSSNTNASLHNQHIKELFNYTKEIHELLLGNVLLTKMKAAERKKWFSVLSDSDLAYALEFYKNSRIELRNVTGTITTTKQAIGKLSPQVIDDEAEFNATKARIELLQKDISTLDRELEECTTVAGIDEDTLVRHNERLMQLSNAILSIDTEVSNEVWDADIEQVKTDIAVTSKEIDVLLEQQNGLTEKLERVAKISDINIDDLFQMEKDFNVTCEEYKQRIPKEFLELLTYSLEDINKAIGQHDNYVSIVVKALELTDCELDTTNIATRCQDLEKEYNDTKLRYNELDMTSRHILERIRANDTVHDVDCPKCNFKFKPGVGANENEMLSQQLRAVETDKRGIEAELVKLNQLLERYREISNALRAVNESINSNVSRPTFLLMNHLNSLQAFVKDGKLHTSLVCYYVNALHAAKHWFIGQDRIKQVQSDIAAVQAVHGEDYTALREMNDSITAKVQTLQATRNGLNKLLSDKIAYIGKTERLKALYDQLESGMVEHETLEKTLIDNIRAEILKEHRDDLWNAVIVAKQRFEDMDRARMRLELLKEELASNEMRCVTLKEIVKAMSPDTGILAKYLYQSITKITDFMSTYIDTMWHYKVKVLPCVVKDSELDYQFPFWVDSPAKLNKDVSHGSKAQKEVIDFVFVMAAYRALKLNNYPLLLDELGSGFSEGHKPEMIKFIKSLVSKGQNSQVLMISHDPLTHFQLNHADVLVLDPNGVTLPETYNEHVTIN